ncbi:MAG: TIGR02646 family protein [Oceanobacter sp.]
MKYIAKRKGQPDCIHDRHDHPPASAKEARRKWGQFVGKRESGLLFDLLLEEQYGLCAYSEIRPDEHELGFHVEHVKPKSKYPAQTFDHHNLVLSALSSQDLNALKTEYGDNTEESESEPMGSYYFGGHAKKSTFNAELFLSPLQEYPHNDYYLYLSDGRVVAHPLGSESDQQRTQYTIDVLNLNHPMLVALRKEWIDEIDAFIDEHLENDMCLESLASIDLIPTNSRLSNFFTATSQRFGTSITDIVLNT